MGDFSIACAYEQCVLNSPRILQTPPDWTPEEKPTLPGSPPNIAHSYPKRLVYFTIGIFVAICGGLSNGFISANLPQIQGEYGLTPSQVVWLPAVFVIGNLSSNLLLFKARQQYGLRWFTELFLLAYMVLMFIHIFVQNYPMVLLVRGVSGFVGAPLSSLGMYYVMQAFTNKYRIQSLFIGFGVSQLAMPLAWLLSPHLVNVNDWSRLYTFEFGLAVCCYAMVVAVKLPRTLLIEAFEKKDIITFMLLTPGIALLCGVMVQGTILWWTNSVTLAYMLIGAWAFLLLGFGFEHYRKNPLIMTRWLGSWGLIRFIIGGSLLRMIMSEQSFAVSNFLKLQGVMAEQLVGFYTVVFFGILSGTIASAVTFSREHMILPLIVAVILVFAAGMYDANMLTSDVKPENFYISQFVVAFASALFMGSLLLIGFGLMMKQSANHIVTFIILFGATQSFGGLGGSAFYSTLQQQRTQYHKQAILQQMDTTDATVTQRLKQYQGGFKTTLNDATLVEQQAQQSLNQIVTREAQIKAYGDVITANNYLALFLLVWGLINISHSKLLVYREKKLAVAIPSTK